MAPLKVFAFDYVAAGGPIVRSLPQSLRRQGEMLRQALLADLGALPEVELATMTIAEGEAMEAQQPFSERFDACVRAADAVWPLASESDGLLERLSRDILRGKRVLLGSAPGAVQVAASKLKLSHALAKAGVPVAATYSPHAPLPGGVGAWVVKPDDGAGCLDTRLFSDRAAALAWIRLNACLNARTNARTNTMAGAEEDYVLQPFIAGRLGSLSLLCCDGVARVLSRNQERVAMRDNRFHYLGSTVNGLGDHDGALERLAQQVAAAIPSLWGYVGVDFVLTTRGAVVLDVNPRLTAAYAGVHASIGRNPAGLVLELLKGPAAMPAPVTARRTVSVDVAVDSGGDSAVDSAGSPWSPT
jgi:predicted ATP-grasp superfamily ATP-dependent carboligase